MQDFFHAQYDSSWLINVNHNNGVSGAEWWLIVVNGGEWWVKHMINGSFSIMGSWLMIMLVMVNYMVNGELLVVIDNDEYIVVDGY